MRVWHMYVPIHTCHGTYMGVRELSGFGSAPPPGQGSGIRSHSLGIRDSAHCPAGSLFEKILNY